MLTILLIVLLVVAMIGVAPVYGYSSTWGWGPGGLIGLVLIVLLIFLLLGHRF